MYAPDYDEGWKRLFEKLDNSVKIRIAKKIKQILNELPGRHLEHGVPYFVEDVGQHRICYYSFEETKTRRFFFVGDHKEYQRWVHEQG